MKVENNDPVESLNQIKTWVEKAFSYPDTSIVTEARKRHRTIEDIIAGLELLNIPLPDNVIAEKENIEVILASSIESQHELEELAQELSSLAQLIKHRMASMRKTRAKSRRKGPNKKLQVTLPDGTVICDDKAADTFTRTIQYLGVQEVTALPSIRSSKNPVVSASRQTKGRNLCEIEGHYIETHSNTPDKARFLMRIAKELDIDLSVDVIDQ